MAIGKLNYSNFYVTRPACQKLLQFYRLETAISSSLIIILATANLTLKQLSSKTDWIGIGLACLALMITQLYVYCFNSALFLVLKPTKSCKQKRLEIEMSALNPKEDENHQQSQVQLSELFNFHMNTEDILQETQPNCSSADQVHNDKTILCWMSISYLSTFLAFVAALAYHFITLESKCGSIAYLYYSLQ